MTSSGCPPKVRARRNSSARKCPLIVVNTFERQFRHFDAFIDRIRSYQPNYLVPVAKKGAKLLKASGALDRIAAPIRYRTYFDLEPQTLDGARIAVVDDATQYTATLREHRGFFESLGAQVRTYSFVGHDALFSGEHERYDEQAEIFTFLREPVYQEYILQQSYFLLRSGHHFDLDHLVFVLPATDEQISALLSLLSTRGYLLTYDDYFLHENVTRFSLDAPDFFSDIPYLRDANISLGSVRKLKFAFDRSTNQLHFAPLVFPTWTITPNSPSLERVPWRLPFPTTSTVLSSNDVATRRTYYNLWLVYTIAFAKAFLQQAPQLAGTELTIKDFDLRATIGDTRTADTTAAILAYLGTGEHEAFATQPVRTVTAARRPFQTFAQVIDYLKNQYQRELRRRGTRLGVHYVLPYDDLYARFPDHVALAEHLDFYCDFGALVPEMIVTKHQITRGCRTGEPIIDYAWERNRLLVPLALHQFLDGTTSDGVSAMAFNKLLASFAFDYPREEFNELHCLITQPYTFGALVRCYHRLRAPSMPSIYAAKKISPHYTWDVKTRQFRPAPQATIAGPLKAYFDDEQEVPFAVIYNYFSLLTAIFRYFGERVDILNLLSVCREQNYFYAHVTYNVLAAMEAIFDYVTTLGDQPDVKALHRAGTEANSGIDKLQLFLRAAEVMQEINTTFAVSLQYVKSLERINKSYAAPDNNFLHTVTQLHNILRYQRFVLNEALFAETRQPKYRKQARTISAELQRAAAPVPTPLPARTDAAYTRVLDTLIGTIGTQIRSLPSGQPPLEARLKREARDRAKNRLTRYVYDQALPTITLLFLDLSGLRGIPEPKEDVVAAFYRIVEGIADQRGGTKMYGGNGGDDEYTYVFVDVPPAVECAKDIKREVLGHLFLGPRGLDVKFGIAIRIFTSDAKEKAAIEAWGEAKDSCTYKSTTFRNRGDLLLAEQSLGPCRELAPTIADRFRPLDEETLKGHGDRQRLYRLPDLV